jgi:hypothetical protein
LVFRVVLSNGLSHQNLVHFSLLSHAYHMPRPPHSSWLELPNDIWRIGTNYEVPHRAISSILSSPHPS